jgi:Flp pilus assembly CpaE family ATPase
MTELVDFQPITANQRRTDATRVLVVEDNCDYESLLRSALGAGDHAFDLEFVRTLSGALQTIQLNRPEVILVDLNLEDSSGYSTFLRIREAAPGVCVIVVTAVDDERVAFRALRDGAQDYLVKSRTHPRGLAKRIQMALRYPGRHAPQRNAGRGLVLGFLGSKGGVGTSTVAENLGAILAREGGPTVLVDLQRSSQQHGPRPAPAHELSDLLGKPATEIIAADLKDCSLELAPDLYLLRMKPAEGVWQALAPEYVSAILSRVREFSSYVVVDLGSRIDHSASVALKDCDSLTIVVDTEVAAVDCCATLLHQLDVVMGSEGPEIHLVTVDRLHHNHRIVANRIAARLKIRPSLTVTAAPDELSHAYLGGAPLLSLQHPDVAFARSMQALSDLLLSSQSVQEPIR